MGGRLIIRKAALGHLKASLRRSKAQQLSFERDGGSLWRGKVFAPSGPAAGDEAGFRGRELQPFFASLFPHKHGERGKAANAVSDPTIWQRTPFEKAGLQTFGEGFPGLHAENPVVASQGWIVIGGGMAVGRHDARPIVAGDAPGGVS